MSHLLRNTEKNCCEIKNIGIYKVRFSRIDGRVVEGARLEIVCTSKGYREFESHSIRQQKNTPEGVFFYCKRGVEI